MSKNLYEIDQEREITIEGTIKKYQNKFKGFGRRYFLIRGEILEYYHAQEDIGSKRPKWVHLECVDVMPKKDWDLKLKDGLNSLHLKFDTLSLKEEWIQKIVEA